MKVIYKITYPYGKIYIGKDLTNTANYYGSANSNLNDLAFLFEQFRGFSITKVIIWWSETATDSEVNVKKVWLVNKFNANNLLIGYKRWPKHKAVNNV